MAPPLLKQQSQRYTIAFQETTAQSLGIHEGSSAGVVMNQRAGEESACSGSDLCEPRHPKISVYVGNDSLVEGTEKLGM